jgi:hypothetical protein
VRKLILMGAVLAMAVVVVSMGGPASAGHYDCPREFPQPGKTYTVKVMMTINPRLQGGKLTGTVDETCGPNGLTAGYYRHTCQEAGGITIKRAQRGRDKTVGKIFSYPRSDSSGRNIWSMQGQRLKGDRVYAKRAGYRLPNKPVYCTAARTRTVLVR